MKYYLLNRDTVITNPSYTSIQVPSVFSNYLSNCTYIYLQAVSIFLNGAQAVQCTYNVYRNIGKACLLKTLF